MHQLLKSYLIMYAAVFAAAFGQLSLKFGARTKSRFYWWMKPWYIAGLSCMVLSLILSLRALRDIPLKDTAFIIPTIYILIPILSCIFLKERFGKKIVLGIVIVTIGIIVFNLPVNIISQ